MAISGVGICTGIAQMCGICAGLVLGFLAKWVKDIIWQMGRTCREADKFLAAGLADVLKPGYETFERPRFERGTCCESLRCQKVD